MLINNYFSICGTLLYVDFHFNFYDGTSKHLLIILQQIRRWTSETIRLSFTVARLTVIVAGVAMAAIRELCSAALVATSGHAFTLLVELPIRVARQTERGQTCCASDWTSEN